VRLRPRRILVRRKKLYGVVFSWIRLSEEAVRLQFSLSAEVDHTVGDDWYRELRAGSGLIALAGAPAVVPFDRDIARVVRAQPRRWAALYAPADSDRTHDAVGIAVR
jgi:hypothetical protein